MIVPALNSRSKSRMFATFAPRKLYTDWSSSPTANTAFWLPAISFNQSNCSRLVSWNSSTRMCAKRAR